MSAMNDTPAEQLVNLRKSEFKKSVRMFCTKELQRVYECCSFETHREHWEIAKLELDRRQQRVNLWIGVVAATAAIVAAIASVYAILRH